MPTRSGALGSPASARKIIEIVKEKRKKRKSESRGRSESPAKRRTLRSNSRRRGTPDARGRSVSFSRDTKEDDGDSRDQLHRRARLLSKRDYESEEVISPGVEQGSKATAVPVVNSGILMSRNDKRTSLAAKKRAMPAPKTPLTMGDGSLLNYVKIGARLHPLEWLPLMFSPLVWWYSSDPIHDFFVHNGVVMCCFFAVMVQIPAFLTERMAYVDLGWPWGLVIVAGNCYIFGQGFWLRKLLVCGALGVHGLRMGLGALFLFYPYDFKTDLPRYEYAKVRWQQEGMPVEHWWIKIQHDTLQQCFANICVLPAPVILAAMNPRPEIHPVEVLGLVIWALSWGCENAADVSKQLFLKRCKKEGQHARTDVLGYEPWNGKEFYLWTLCRHPNYFFELMSWVGLSLTGACSIASVDLSTELQLGFTLILLALLRFFYDCLVYWTGAEPAEHFSVLKRPLYKAYQSTTRCFFPFEVPFFNHHRVAGWPAKSGQP